MVDIVDKATRSRMMSLVRAKNTRLELEIRRRLFIMGFRYRLHRNDFFGNPDMVLKKHSAVIFIHGCFWHQHGCWLSQLPSTRREWWKKKLEGNNIRDKNALLALREKGWRVLVIRECSFRQPGINRTTALDRVALKAYKFLYSQKELMEISQLPGSTKKVHLGHRKVNVREKRR